MRAELRGKAGRAVGAIIGSWDPLTESHLKLFRTLACRASIDGLQLCAVVITPSPLRYMQAKSFRDFDDLETRLALIRESEIETILIVHFGERDLDAPAETFLRLVCRRLALKRLWLGATQSLGRGLGGSRATIMTLASGLGFELVVLPIDRESQDVRRIWAHLARGEISAASHLMGRPPVRARSPCSWVQVGWPAGNYRAVPLEQARDVLSPRWQPQASIDLQVVRRRQSATAFKWPSSPCEWLAIVDRCKPGLRERRIC